MSDWQQSHEIRDRLKALEQSHHRLQARCECWKRAGMGLSACLGIVLLAGAAITSHPTIEGGEFVLRDKSNRMRAALAIRPDGTPGFALFDDQGKVRLSMELSLNGDPGVNLISPAGALGAALAIRPDGTPGIGLFDNQGRVRTSLDVGLDGTSGVNIFDPSGVLRAAMAIRPDGTPGVGLFDPEGEVLPGSLNEQEPSMVARPRFVE